MEKLSVKTIDLIGRVVSITEQKVVQVNSNPQRLIDFVIEDSRGSRLTVTLCEEHVDSVLPYYNVDLAEPLIVILQLCRAWVNKGK
nr:replication factor A protein 1-like isoform X2 [Ipomoea batatas]